MTIKINNENEGLNEDELLDASAHLLCEALLSKIESGTTDEPLVIENQTYKLTFEKKDD